VASPTPFTLLAIRTGRIRWMASLLQPLALVRNAASQYFRAGWVGIIFFALLSLSARAEVKEISHIADAFRPGNGDTLYLLDLDDTTYTPVGVVLTASWLQREIQFYQRQGYKNEEAVRLAKEDQKAGTSLVKVRWVEDVLPNLIADAKKSGSKVLGLTARPLDDQPSTDKQLSSLVPDGRQIWSNDSDGLGHFSEKFPQVGIQQGIIYCGNQDKGQVLKEYLNKVGLPKRIVFVDDAWKRVNAVANVIARLPTQVEIYHYDSPSKKLQTPPIRDSVPLSWLTSREGCNDNLKQVAPEGRREAF